MLRQSSPKNITCHFNSSQKTIAERYALTQYFKNTRLYLRTLNILISSTLTVDKFISKTIILLRISHYCTEKCDLSFQFTYHMISVHVSALFKKLFITEAIREKCKRTKMVLYAKNTLDWRKIKMINAPLRIQQVIHLTRLDCSSFRTWFGKFSDMIEEKHTTIESRQSTKDKTKKTTCRDISQKSTSLFFRRPLSNCLLCWVDDAVVRSRRIVGLADSSRTAAC